MNPRPQPPVEEEPPPFLGTWRRVYTAVIVYLAFLIALFYTFSVVFTPAAAR